MRNQKTPIARTLPLAGQRAALREIKLRGYSLPCHVTAIDGQIVTVAFDVESEAPLPPCQMPVSGAEYVRMPIQINCKGVCRPSSVDIGIVTGLGPGTSLPNLNVLPGNLSALVFEPVGNSTWAASPYPNGLVLYGPSGGQGVVLQDKLTSPSSVVSVTSSGINLTCGSHSISITSGGDITIDGQKFLTHFHNQTDGGTYVAPSGGGPVTGASGPVAGS